MKKENPKYLYKYRPVNRHTLNMISSNEAYFSLPIDFNDPFDCNIVPEIIYTSEEFEIFVNSLKEREDGQVSQNEIKNLLENPVETLEHNWKGTINNIRNNLRIFCLSAINNNVMMYSHYAEGHKGICLEFLVSDDPFYGSLDYVRYTEKIPVFHPFNENQNIIQKELMEIEVLTKACTWFYEEEWRIIKRGPNPFMYKFSPNILTSIIFGYQTSSDNKLLIERVINKRVPSIQLKEAFKKEKSFDLGIRPYKS